MLYYDIIDFLLQFADDDPRDVDEVDLYEDHIQHEVAEALARSTETQVRTVDAIAYAMFCRGMRFAGRLPMPDKDDEEDA